MFPRDVEDRNDEVPFNPRRAANSTQNRANLPSLILTYWTFPLSNKWTVFFIMIEFMKNEHETMFATCDLIV